jgi:hypothetical protein
VPVVAAGIVLNARAVKQNASEDVQRVGVAERP